MRSPKSIITLAWYRSEQWALLRAVSTDANVLEDTYEAWRVFASKQQQDLERRGLLVQRVDIDVTDLVRWCEQSGNPVDGSARAQYAQERLQQSQ